jgi:hypothetical protein
MPGVWIEYFIIVKWVSFSAKFLLLWDFWFLIFDFRFSVTASPQTGASLEADF